MAQGGGTQLLAGDGRRIIGPGGQSLLKDNNRWLLGYHFSTPTPTAPPASNSAPSPSPPKPGRRLASCLNSPE